MNKRKPHILIIYLLALFPIIFVVSVTSLTSLVFFLTLFPKSLLLIKPLHIAALILAILQFLYGLRLKKLQVNLKHKKVYYTLLLAIYIILWIVKINVVYVLGLLISIGIVEIFALEFETGFQNVRTYFKRSRNTFFACNLFDTFFIAICFGLKDIEIDMHYVLNELTEWISISQNSLELILIYLFGIISFILLPFFRGMLSVCCYIKQNGIGKRKGRVFWNTYFMAYFISLLQISVYLYNFFAINSFSYSVVLVYLFLMSVTVFFWTIIVEGIDKGGEDKENVLSLWALVVLLLSILVLLDQIESDFVGILTWFLPILIPIFIGEVYKVVPGAHSMKPTLAMQKHLYWLQIMCFNTLLLFNIWSSISTVEYVQQNGEIIQENMYRSVIIFFLEKYVPSSPLIGGVVSFLILIFMIFVAYLLSKLMIYLIQRTYISSSKKYFN